MIEGSIVTAVFMIFQVFFLTRWINKHEENKERAAWLPFRKLLLDSIIQHTDALAHISKHAIDSIDSILNSIKCRGSLRTEDYNDLVEAIQRSIFALEKARSEFYNRIQTVGPSLKPYAAQYCNEVFWFSDVVLKSLNKATNYAKDINLDQIDDNEHTSHPLNGVWAMMVSIKMFRDLRFSSFKKNFTQTVWKTESLHYFEDYNEFLPPEDYKNALDSEKSKSELSNIPRTSPIKSFFETD